MIKLCMILRDEAHCIARTLHSVAPFVDSFCVVDTGSTDGTPACVRAIFGQHHVPGEVHSLPFVDYATTRNACLDLARASGPAEPFLFMLDAEDELVNGPSLRFMLQIQPPTATAFSLRQDWPGVQVMPVRIIRSDSPWRYEGKVHESFVHPDKQGNVAIMGPSLRHFPTQIGHARTRARWPRDVQLLRERLAECPDDARAQWHLDRTLEAMAAANSQATSAPPS